MKKEKLTFGLEIKEFKDEDPKYFTFKGYLATSGNVDHGDDRIMPGAFKTTIENWKKRNQFVPTLWQHSMPEPIGVFTEMREDAIGLYVEGRLPKSDTFVSGRVIPQMEVGSITAMSIGYRAVKFSFDSKYVRNLEEIDLIEGSLVTRPMNDRAVITGFKSISEFKSMPCAPRDTPWDAEAALKRIQEAGLESDAHLWVSETAKKFLVADMIEGKLTIVPRALAKAALEIHAGDDEISSEETEGLKRAVAVRYKEMNLETPFQEKDCVRVDFAEQLTPRELERLFRKGVSFSQTEAKRLVKFIADGQRDVEPKADREDPQNWTGLIEAVKKFNSLKD